MVTVVVEVVTVVVEVVTVVVVVVVAVVVVEDADETSCVLAMEWMNEDCCCCCYCLFLLPSNEEKPECDERHLEDLVVGIERWPKSAAHWEVPGICVCNVYIYHLIRSVCVCVYVLVVVVTLVLKW